MTSWIFMQGPLERWIANYKQTFDTWEGSLQIFRGRSTSGSTTRSGEGKASTCHAR